MEEQRSVGVSRRELSSISLAAGAGMMVVSGAAHAASGLPPKSPPAADRFAIDDLYAAYLWSYDCSDEQGFLDLFTGDALVVGMGKVHSGREAMGAWFRYLLDIRDREGDLWVHTAAHHHYVPAAKGWIVYSYATHFRSAPDGKSYGVRSLGYFVNHIVQEDGAWKFRRFSISHWDKKAKPWTKPLPWAEADKL